MNVCVIGIGRFGYSVATTLAEHGIEVLAVDCNEQVINEIQNKVTQALCMKIIDEESLRSIGIEDVDTVVVAMGENISESILVTALLKQKLKIPTVITRSVSQIHKEILQLIGADHVVLPEQEMGMRLADRLSATHSNFTRITSSYSLTYVKAPHKFIGKAAGDLALHKSYGVSLLGTKLGETITAVDDEYIIHEDDVLAFAGDNKKLEKLARLH